MTNLLCGSDLNTTRKTRPSARGKNGVCDSFSIGSKTNNLLENIFSFPVHCSTRFKHDGSEVVIRLLKCSGVSIDFLMLSVRLTRLRRVKMRGQMTATSMARPRRTLQSLIETSPGRRRDLSVGPRIPNFSISGRRRPVSASLNTRFLRRLCLVILSPDFLQHSA